MNLRKLFLLCGALLLVLSAGCVGVATRKAGSVAFGEKGSVMMISRSDRNPLDYNRVEVARLTDELGAKMPSAIPGKIQGDLIRRINEDENIKGFYRAVAFDQSSVEQALVIEGVVLDYEEGNRAKRAATFGGEAFVIVRFTVRDKNSGETLAVFNSRGFLKDSLMFGGDMNNAIAQVNAGVLQYLRGRE